MEWVETTGRTLAEAVDAALDQLGVHEDEADIEVLSEGKPGILGRIGARDARVRARVKPVSREKRHRRRGSREASSRKSGPKGGRGGGRSGATKPAEKPEKPATGSDRPKGPAGDKPGSKPRGRGRRRTGGEGQDDTERGAEMTSEMTVEEQAAAATDFVRDLVDAFGVRATTDTSIADDVISIDVSGDDLGTLVGQGGATLKAIEDLTRTVMQRRAGRGARIRVDIGGYQAKRREALAEFAKKLARRVVETGKSQALEPMSAADRKVVHDAAAEVGGVETVSEGEDSRRRVIIHKA